MSTVLGMTDPSTISGMKVTALLQQIYDSKAHLESVKKDPIFNNANLVHPISVVDNQAVPMVDQFFIDVTPKNTGARNITLAFISSFDQDPIEGNVQFLGNETSFDMKWTKCYANDWAGGVTLQNFGIDARELRDYGLNQQARKLLYQWKQEVLGYYAREALVQRISHNLTASPLSLTQTYNKNWWVPYLADADQPTYSATAANHATNIGNACNSAAMNAVLTPSLLLQLVDYLENSYLTPVRIGSKMYYAMLTSPREIRRLRDPAVSGSFGDYFVEAASLQDVNKVIPTAELVVAESLILIRDPRNPTMTLTGTGSAYTLTFGYEKYGRKSTKTSGISQTGSTLYWNLNIVLGAGALMWYEPEKVHDEKQSDEYTQYEGSALFGAIGYQTPVWNDDDEGATEAQQESSFIVPTVKT